MKSATRRSRDAGAAAAEGAGAPPSRTHVVALNLTELPALLQRYGLPPMSELSPLVAFLREEPIGTPRPIEEVLRPVAAVADVVMRWALTPLCAPDRVIEARLALFNGAPFPMRLYSSRRVDGIFAGVRPGTEFDYELLAPYTAADLQMWFRHQMQFGGGQNIPAPQEELSAGELAFLFALVDAHKAKALASYATRVETPAPVMVTLADIVEAQNLALAHPDRRWLTRATMELLGAVVHPGGTSDVRLPLVTEAIARREIRRLADVELIQDLTDGKNPSFSLGSVLAMLCGSLMTWVCILTLHDIQVAGIKNGKPVAGEELVMFIITEATVWTIVSEGLARAEGDLGPVRFGIRSSSPIYAREIAANFVQPLAELDPPDAVYAPVADVARQGAEATAAATVAPAASAAPVAPAPPPSARRAPKWQPTHTIPEGGLDAWAEPDPELAPVAELDEGLEVQVTERLGDWAKVLFENGWSGWTDGRELVETGA